MGLELGVRLRATRLCQADGRRGGIGEIWGRYRGDIGAVQGDVGEMYCRGDVGEM